MNTREDEVGKFIRTHLELGREDLRAGVVYRLQHARAAALARAAGTVERTASLAQPATAGDGRNRSASNGRPHYLQPAVWIGLLAAVALMLGYQQWTGWSDLQDLEDLDAQILTSDLPIDAYLDRGFQLWLKTSNDPQ